MVKEDVPPPVIEVGPYNQSLAPHSSLSLPCQGKGVPPPDIQWYKDGSPLPLSGEYNRTIILWSNGTLYIQGTMSILFFKA